MHDVECKILECNRNVYLKSICSHHYYKNRRRIKKCLVFNCRNKVWNLNLCYHHKKTQNVPQCKVPDCSQSNLKNGLCKRHLIESSHCEMDCKERVRCKNLCIFHYHKEIREKKKEPKSDHDPNDALDLASLFRR